MPLMMWIWLGDTRIAFRNFSSVQEVPNFMKAHEKLKVNEPVTYSM